MARTLADRLHAAAYLELAQCRSLPLATLDRDFIGATKALNIELLSPCPNASSYRCARALTAVTERVRTLK